MYATLSIKPELKAQADKIVKDFKDSPAQGKFKHSVISQAKHEIKNLYLKAQDGQKLKFLSAFRIFRKVQAPKVKNEFPNLTGKERQIIIRDQWKTLETEIKKVFVM